MEVIPFNHYTFFIFDKIDNPIFEPQIRTKRYLNEQFGPMGILTEDDEEKMNMTFEELIKLELNLYIKKR